MILQGNKGLLNTNLAAILNSSQSKTPCGDDPWIRGSIKAVDYLLENKYTEVSSIGLSTWELIVYLAARQNGSQIIVSPYADNGDGSSVFERTLKQFDLDITKTAMVFVKPDSDSKKIKSNWLKRDKAVMSLAELILPVSIRRKGKLDTLLKDSDKIINTNFQIDYVKPRAKPPRYDIKNITSNLPGRDFITHWTRTHHGPWPDETKAGFYNKLINSGSLYPNNAFNSLQNIIIKKAVRGSSNRIRNKIRCVGFSGLDSHKMLAQMRWLPKRVNWNFEPYGVAIRRSAADRIGIKPVIYGNDVDYKDLQSKDKPYFQHIGAKDVDWSIEKEWRKIGDVDLSRIDSNDIAYIVWCEKEANLLRKITPSEVPVFSIA